MTTAAHTDLIHRIYIAVLGRPADLAALQTYGALLDANFANVGKLAAAVAASNEATDLYAGRTTAQMIDIVHQHLFGKAADVGTRERIAAQFDSGTIDMNSIVTLFLAAAGASGTATADAKLAAAKAITALIDTPAELQAAIAAPSLERLRDYLDGVSDQTLATSISPRVLGDVLLGIGAATPLSTPAQIEQQVQEMYVAFFGRAAESAGLQYWARLFDGKPSEATQDLLAGVFGTSREYLDTYGNRPTAAVVETVYQNLFGRSGETAGVQYWSTLLDQGTIGLNNVVKAISEGARGSDLFAYDAKVRVAAAITAEIDTPAETLAYAATNSIALVRAYVGRVTDAATFTAAIDPVALKKLIDSMVLIRGQSDFFTVLEGQAEPAAVLVGMPEIEPGIYF